MVVVCLAVAAVVLATLHYVPELSTLPDVLLLICPLLLVLYIIQQFDTAFAERAASATRPRLKPMKSD